jgi:hypothetical protein
MGEKRLNVRLTEDAYGEIVHLAESQGKSISELIRDSLALEKWFYDTRRHGGQVLVQRRGEQQPKQVVLAR